MKHESFLKRAKEGKIDHLSEQGYEIRADGMAPLLKELMK